MKNKIYIPGKGLNPKVCIWLPLILLIFVAVIQQTALRKTLLSPWKGGGFGMFSTIQSPANRFLQCYLVLNDGVKVPIKLSDKAKSSIERFQSFPSVKTAEEISFLIKRTQWIQMDPYDSSGQSFLLEENKRSAQFARPMTLFEKRNQGEKALHYDAIEFHLYRISFAKDTGKITAIPMKKIRRPISPVKGAP